MTWPYIAGFLDGEGCFHAVGSDGAGTGRYRVTIAQSLDIGRQTLEEIADFLKAHDINAYVLKHHRAKRPDNAHWRTMWNLWITEQRSIVLFIEGVFPYLRIKKSRAEDYRRLCILYPSMRGLTAQDRQGKIDRAKFRELVEMGLPLTEIAHLFDMDYSSVWMKAKRMGLHVDTTEESNRRRAKVPFETVVALFNETGSFQETARRLKMPAWNVRTRLIKNGITPNEPYARGGRQKGVKYD